MGNDIFEGFEARIFSDDSRFEHPMPYRLFKPEKYDNGQSYPMVIYLHGGGEEGTDNKLQITENLGAMLFAKKENQDKYPCFILAPQHPSGTYWESLVLDSKLGYHRFEPGVHNFELDIVVEIIEGLQKEFDIDSSRLYITGLSDGGFGTWGMIARRPDLIAAAAPICGDGDISKVSLFAHIPIWAFHGEDDAAVSVQLTRDMTAAMQEAGGDPKYTEYKGIGHNSWFEAYSEPELIPWMFSQKKEQK